MHKKEIFLIIGILLIILIIVMTAKNINDKEKMTINNGESNSNEINYVYNSENQKYEIIDKSTGEIITQAETQEEIEDKLEFYKQNPDYRAEPPFSGDL